MGLIFSREVKLEKASKIYIAGHTGPVGLAIVRELERQGFKNLLLVGHESLDLRKQAAVEAFLMAISLITSLWRQRRLRIGYK